MMSRISLESCRPIYNTVFEIKGPKVANPVIIVSRKMRSMFYMAARQHSGNSVQAEITPAGLDGFWFWMAQRKACDQLNINRSNVS